MATTQNRDPARAALAQSITLTSELLCDIIWARIEAEVETGERTADPALAARLRRLRERVREAAKAWEAAHAEHDGYLLRAWRLAARDPKASGELLEWIGANNDAFYERWRPHLTAFHDLLIPAREAGEQARAGRRAARLAA